jgi:hypothetical protein
MEDRMATVTEPTVKPAAETAESMLLGEVLARATSDAEFRRRLLDDPRAALAEMGLKLPEGLRLGFVERPPDVDLLLPLPPLQPPGAGPGDGELAQTRADVWPCTLFSLCYATCIISCVWGTEEPQK